MDKKGKNKTFKKDNYHSTILVDGVDIRKNADNNPFYYLGTWDFVVVFLAVFLRFLVSTNIKQYKAENVDNQQYKVEEVKGEKFDYKRYFDTKHLIRWAIHLITAMLGIIILPEVLILYVNKKYDIGFTDWALLGSGVIGFLGYDLIRVTEKVLLFILSKSIGYKPDEDEKDKND